jgi:import receptor subunit TOM70
MLYRQGDIAAARRAIESGLARSPGHYNGLSLLAQLELAGGDLRRATELYEQLLERSREVPELTNLGTALLLMGRYEDAAERFREALELSPASPFTLLNLADALLLADRRREALELYRRLLEQMDRAPRSERLLTVQAQALARLGRAPEAVAAIQEALRLAPDSPHESYEAALVFILVGDETSALWNAQRAMAGGFDRRWFDFPWFDPLRPRLREIPPTPPPPS